MSISPPQQPECPLLYADHMSSACRSSSCCCSVGRGRCVCRSGGFPSPRRSERRWFASSSRSSPRANRRCATSSSGRTSRSSTNGLSHSSTAPHSCIYCLTLPYLHFLPSIFVCSQWSPCCSLCFIMFSHCSIYSAIVLYIHPDESRYASLYFTCAVDSTDNELMTLEIIHRFAYRFTSSNSASPFRHLIMKLEIQFLESMFFNS